MNVALFNKMSDNKILLHMPLMKEQILMLQIGKIYITKTHILENESMNCLLSSQITFYLFPDVLVPTHLIWINGVSMFWQ